LDIIEFKEGNDDDNGELNEFHIRMKYVKHHKNELSENEKRNILGKYKHEDLKIEAYEHLQDIVEGKDLIADVITKSGSSMSIMLYTKDSGAKTIASSVNAQLLAEGLVMVEKNWIKRVDNEIVERVKNMTSSKKIIKSIPEVLIEIQEQAKKSRVNAWRYGDITEDDEF